MSLSSIFVDVPGGDVQPNHRDWESNYCPPFLEISTLNLPTVTADAQTTQGKFVNEDINNMTTMVNECLLAFYK